MVGPPSNHKLSDHARFLDLSDYGRPLGDLIVTALLPTRVLPQHLTLGYTVVGLLAAGLFAAGGHVQGVAAGLLLLLKSALDAADGSLARARGRPSRTGRYLDSLCDFLVNLAVYSGLAWAEAARARSAWPIPVAAAALVAGLLQVSVFNYYYILQRGLAGGDHISLLDETEAHPYPWDPPRLTRLLQRAYLAIYGWQDRLVARLDRLAVAALPASRHAPSTRFLTATTAAGLGSQLLLIALAAVVNHPFWALLFFLGPGTAYCGFLLLWRRRSRAIWNESTNNNQ